MCLGKPYALIGSVDSSIKQGEKSDTKRYCNVKKPGRQGFPTRRSKRACCPCPFLDLARLDYLDSLDDRQTILTALRLTSMLPCFRIIAAVK
jgi:hypothetical protein